MTPEREKFVRGAGSPLAVRVSRYSGKALGAAGRVAFRASLSCPQLGGLSV